MVQDEKTREHNELVLAVYDAHEAQDTSRVDDLAQKAEWLHIHAPDVLRRLADLKRWRDEGGAR